MTRLKRLLPLVLLLMMLVAILQAPPAVCLPAAAGSEAQMTVYFAGWDIYSSSAAQVKNLPWDHLDAVNHAFWKIVPEKGGFALAPADAWADLGPDNPNAHFAQYAACRKKYPRVDLLLSIGGWTCCGYFSQMCLTRDSRSSFISSCLDTLEAYPFFTGLDIDWEYPGVPRKGGKQDEGNPVVGDDKTNYTLLLKELRAALDDRFGAGTKRLTVCAGASKDILDRQDYAALHPYVDRINLMTYDFAGLNDRYTAHQSPLYGEKSADSAVRLLLAQGVPAAKIAIGSPFYSHGWKLTQPSANPLGAPATGLSSATRLWKTVRHYESSAVSEGIPGWHAGYDEAAQAAYLWNDDSSSKDHQLFLTYESSHSLSAKLQYIRDMRLGGLIVWEAGGDDEKQHFPMLTQAYDFLHP